MSDDEGMLERGIAEWRGKMLIDREGAKIGKLQDVYVDVETDEPVFGTVKEGLFNRRHLTFVPLRGVRSALTNFMSLLLRRGCAPRPTWR